ncbi:hypothetical protein ACFV7Q_31615 [Streptomyces sp. NPDC059851]|uniref:hypothetical protein n=1 Tax=Streptomyces sp. NPDC059851 TaxID=3346971 RepID=UPI003659052E
MSGSSAVADPSSASAAASCRKSQDSNTFGTYCSSAEGRYFRAVAVCKNGQEVRGQQWKRVGSGSWSWAYCTQVNSSLSWGYAEIGN